MAFVTFICANLTAILAVIVATLGLVWLWVQHHYAYWKRQNIAYIKPSIPFGNFKEMITWKADPCTHFRKLYNHESAVGNPAVGIFVVGKPGLLIRDLQLVKNVLIKDFSKFSNRYTASDPHSDPLGADNLFFVKNPRWKDIRVKLTPIFTSGKIKQMFALVDEIGLRLNEHLCSISKASETHSTVQEVKTINALFTTDVIASVAYGIHANSLGNPNGEFRTNGKRIFHFTRRRALEFSAMFLWPAAVKFLRIKVFSRETTDFIRKTFTYVMKERIKSGATRNDLIDILVGLRQQAEAEGDSKSFVLEPDFLIAQAAIFFSAGFETSSATMSFTLYELSRREDLQQRLRDEINTALQSNDGKITYELIQDMKFLHNVVQEILRLFPPLPFLDRECTLAEGEKSYSLKPFCDYEVPHGMPVIIPIHALHTDPKYFPDPQTFDPDRWAPENKHRVNTSAYMPFGTGPHNCIGERFGLLQTKIGLINFLRNHYVTPCEKSHPTMKLDPRALVISSEGGIYCNVVYDPLI